MKKNSQKIGTYCFVLIGVPLMGIIVLMADKGINVFTSAWHESIPFWIKCFCTWCICFMAGSLPVPFLALMYILYDKHIKKQKNIHMICA